jgi:hypothetical protein
MKRLATLTVLTLSLSGLPAYAAERPANEAAAATSTTENSVTPLPPVYPALSPAQWVAANRRPTALPALYASFAALQMFDVYSTRRAISGGAHEANPMMKDVVGNKAAFYTMKAATTIAPMLAAERLWKTNKIAAIAVMAASNGIMAVVAAHNSRVLGSQR